VKCAAIHCSGRKIVRRPKAECFFRDPACKRSGRHFEILNEAVARYINQMIDARKIFGIVGGFFGKEPAEGDYGRMRRVRWR
jgi:hypothetical protein